MDIIYLEYIRKTAEVGSISKSAQELFISQPYLSKKIQEVESDLGIEIFYRCNKGVNLTPAGRDFINHSNKILEEYDKILGIKDTKDEPVYTFNLSTINSSIASQSFIELLNNEDIKNDKSVLTIKESTREEVIKDIYNYESNIGVISGYYSDKHIFLKELRAKKIEYVPIRQYKPHLIVRKGHPLSKVKCVDKEEVLKYTFVKYSKDTLPIYVDNDQWDYYSYALDVKKRDKIIEVNNRALLQDIIRNTNHYTIGTMGAIKHEETFGLISVPINIPNLDYKVEVGYIYNKNKELNTLSKKYIEILEKNYK